MQYLMQLGSERPYAGNLTLHLGGKTYHFRTRRKANMWRVTINGVALQPPEGLHTSTEALDYLLQLCGLYMSNPRVVA